MTGAVGLFILFASSTLALTEGRTAFCIWMAAVIGTALLLHHFRHHDVNRIGRNRGNFRKQSRSKSNTSY